MIMFISFNFFLIDFYDPNSHWSLHIQSDKFSFSFFHLLFAFIDYKKVIFLGYGFLISEISETGWLLAKRLKDETDTD